MTGRGKARKRAEERELWVAYHSGVFSATAQSGKLKPYKHYWNQVFADKSSGSALLSSFMALQDRGIPMNIRRVN